MPMNLDNSTKNLQANLVDVEPNIMPNHLSDNLLLPVNFLLGFEVRNWNWSYNLFLCWFIDLKLLLYFDFVLLFC